MGFRGPLFGTLVFYFFFAPPAIRSHTWRAPTSELLPRLKAAQRFASGRAAGGLLANNIFCSRSADSFARPVPRRRIFRAIADGLYVITKNLPTSPYWRTCCRPCIDSASARCNRCY